MAEPVLSREEILDALTVPGLNVEAALEPREVGLLCVAIRDLLEKLCGEPAAWMILECVHLKPCSVTLDGEDIEGRRPEHVVPLHALNRSKA